MECISDAIPLNCRESFDIELSGRLRGDLLDKLRQSNEVEITVTGRKSKKRFTTPVWFILQDDKKVILVPTKGSHNNWFKNLGRNSQIELGVGGTSASLRATLARDQVEVDKILDKFRTKYGSMWSESYYTVRDAYVEVPL